MPSQLASLPYISRIDSVPLGLAPAFDPGALTEFRNVHWIRTAATAGTSGTRPSATPGDDPGATARPSTSSDPADRPSGADGR